MPAICNIQQVSEDNGVPVMENGGTVMENGVPALENGGGIQHPTESASSSRSNSEINLTVEADSVDTPSFSRELLVVESVLSNLASDRHNGPRLLQSNSWPNLTVKETLCKNKISSSTSSLVSEPANRSNQQPHDDWENQISQDPYPQSNPPGNENHLEPCRELNRTRVRHVEPFMNVLWLWVNWLLIAERDAVKETAGFTIDGKCHTD